MDGVKNMQCRGLTVHTLRDCVVNRWLGAFQLKQDSVKKKAAALKSRGETEIAVNPTDMNVWRYARSGCVYISLFMNEQRVYAYVV